MKTVKMMKKDYSGCNEEIKNALENGYCIECLVKNFEDQEPFVRMIDFYDDGEYRTTDNGWFDYAVPNYQG